MQEVAEPVRPEQETVMMVDEPTVQEAELAATYHGPQIVSRNAELTALPPSAAWGPSSGVSSYLAPSRATPYVPPTQVQVSFVSKFGNCIHVQRWLSVGMCTQITCCSSTVASTVLLYNILLLVRTVCYAQICLLVDSMQDYFSRTSVCYLSAARLLNSAG